MLNFVRLLSSAVLPAHKLISSNKGERFGGDDTQCMRQTKSLLLTGD